MATTYTAAATRPTPTKGFMRSSHSGSFVPIILRRQAIEVYMHQGKRADEIHWMKTTRTSALSMASRSCEILDEDRLLAYRGDAPPHAGPRPDGNPRF